MPFDAAWFDELRGISQHQLQLTKMRGTRGYRPHVGELCAAHYVSSRFLQETEHFVHVMDGTPYRFDTFFRAYPQHVVNFPRGRAFRKQWNIGFTAGTSTDQDYVRIGIGFRLSGHENADSIPDYLEWQQNVRQRPGAFDHTFQDFGNYYELWDEETTGGWVSDSAVGDLSRIVVADQAPLEGWRFFGRRLWVHDNQHQALIGSHARLR